MSKWHSRWPGDYAFKEGPSRRGPERNHTSTLMAPVALVDHGADTVERRYRELRARQEEQERRRTRGSRVLEGKAPPRPPSPPRPQLPAGRGREPLRIHMMRRAFSSAISGAVALILKRCVTRLELREHHRIRRAKVAAGGFLPPVPAASKAVADALHDMLDPEEKKAADAAKREIDKAERHRKTRLARLSEFDSAKADAEHAQHKVQQARHTARDLEAAYHHAEKALHPSSHPGSRQGSEAGSRPGSRPSTAARSRQASEAGSRPGSRPSTAASVREDPELQEEAAAVKRALDAANNEVTELLHHLREREKLVIKASEALEECGVSVFHLERDRDEAKKVEAGDEHAKNHQRKALLKAKLRKAGGMAGLLKSSTHAFAEGGRGLAKKKSYLAESMFDALSGDERAWRDASFRVADCLEMCDVRALPCVHPACGRFSAPHLERSQAVLVMQKARRGQGTQRDFKSMVQNSRASKFIQKSMRDVRGKRAAHAMGAASVLFKLASEELGPSVAALIGEFCRLPLQQFASLEPYGAFGDRPRAEAISAALQSHAFSDDLACLMTPFLAEAVVKKAPLPKRAEPLDRFSAPPDAVVPGSPAMAIAPTSPLPPRPPSARPPRRPPPAHAVPESVPDGRLRSFDAYADAPAPAPAPAGEEDDGDITAAAVAAALHHDEDASDDDLDPDACVACARTLDALRYACARPRACHAPFLRTVNRRLFPVAFQCPDSGIRRSAAACACSILTNLERLRRAPHELLDPASAASQALAHDAVARGLPALIKAMTKNVDGDFVEAGLDVLTGTCVDLDAPRFSEAYAAGAPHYVQALLLRLALDQFLCGPNTQDVGRDRMARKAGNVLCSLYTDASCRRNSVEEDAHVVCCAALCACSGWICGQQLGCILTGTLAENADVQRSLAPLIPVIAKLMGEVQAAPDVNLAAKVALRACTYVDEAWSNERKAPAWFLASKLDDAGLIGVLESHLYHNPREHIAPDEPWSALPVHEYGMPQDFYGLEPIMPQSTFGNPRPPGWYPGPRDEAAPAPTPAPARRTPQYRDKVEAAEGGGDDKASAVPEGVAGPAQPVR